MKIVIEDTAKEDIDDIFDYNAYYSICNATFINQQIEERINGLNIIPYIGKLIPEVSDTHIREMICRINRRKRIPNNILCIR